MNSTPRERCSPVGMRKNESAGSAVSTLESSISKNEIVEVNPATASTLTPASHCRPVCGPNGAPSGERTKPKLGFASKVRANEAYGTTPGVTSQEMPARGNLRVRAAPGRAGPQASRFVFQPVDARAEENGDVVVQLHNALQIPADLLVVVDAVGEHERVSDRRAVNRLKEVERPDRATVENGVVRLVGVIDPCGDNGRQTANLDFPDDLGADNDLLLILNETTEAAIERADGFGWFARRGGRLTGRCPYRLSCRRSLRGASGLHTCARLAARGQAA